jgi:two-component system chemotaxis response regulator CheB
VAFGASAGGLEAMRRVMGELPSDLGAPVLIVLHTGPSRRSYLPAILNRAGPLPVRQAEDGLTLEANHVYVAAPDHHLMVVDGKMRVVRGPHENGHRPAIDPLFRSVALSYREGAVAVVFSGALDDGAAGAAAVSSLGGSVIVQDPSDAEFPDMPRNAIVADHPYAVLPVARIAEAIVRLVRAPPEGRAEEEVEEELRLERDYAALDEAVIAREDVFPDLSPFACPACGGALWEAPDEFQLRFRCRIGHAYGAETLLTEQSQSLDQSLAAALRALHERADLARRVGRRLRAAGAGERAERYDRVVKESERDALIIRRVLLSRDGNDG